MAKKNSTKEFLVLHHSGEACAQDTYLANAEGPAAAIEEALNSWGHEHIEGDRFKVIETKDIPSYTIEQTVVTTATKY